MGVGVHFALDSFIVVLNSRGIGSNGLISGPSFGSVSIFIFFMNREKTMNKISHFVLKEYFCIGTKFGWIHH
jgi:hypothetical protein